MKLSYNTFSLVLLFVFLTPSLVFPKVNDVLSNTNILSSTGVLITERIEVAKAANKNETTYNGTEISFQFKNDYTALDVIVKPELNTAFNNNFNKVTSKFTSHHTYVSTNCPLVEVSKNNLSVLLRKKFIRKAKRKN